jgi:TRAP-type C4-dicarboxylate transport system permease small subunit
VDKCGLLIPFEDVVSKIAKWLSIIAAAIGFIIMIIAVVDIIMSKLFGVSFPSGVEMIEELNVFLVFWGISYVEIDRGHIRVTLLLPFMAKRLATSLDISGYAIGIIVIGFLTWRALILTQNAFIDGMTKLGRIHFPLWPSCLAVFIGFVLLELVYIIKIAKSISQEQKYPIKEETTPSKALLP